MEELFEQLMTTDTDITSEQLEKLTIEEYLTLFDKVRCIVMSKTIPRCYKANVLRFVFTIPTKFTSQFIAHINKTTVSDTQVNNASYKELKAQLTGIYEEVKLDWRNATIENANRSRQLELKIYEIDMSPRCPKGGWKNW